MARQYVSTVRAERSRATRRLVLDAAAALFLEQGWTPTTMSRVAQRAGVARQTLYLLFASKLAILDACIDDALSAGRGGRVRDMEEYRRMGEGATLRERIGAGAAWLGAAHERSAAIQRVLDQAAVTDAAAAQRLVEREQQRWQEVRHAVTLILGSPHQGPPDAPVVDAVWTLASRDQWLRLSARGWDRDRWEAWFRRQVAAELLPRLDVDE